MKSLAVINRKWYIVLMVMLLTLLSTTVIYHPTEAAFSTSTEVKLVADDNSGSDLFGYSVAIDGDTAIVGAYRQNNSIGAVYVYIHSGNQWLLQTKLIPDDLVTYNYFGASVAISGDLIAVGAFGNGGSTYIYQRSGSTWNLEAKIIASDTVSQDRFGNSVAISGEMVVIGANGNEDFKGAAYVYQKVDNQWLEQSKLTASDGAKGDEFGWAVAVSGDSILVGAYNKANQGAAYIFTRSGDTWSQQAKILPDDPALGYCFGETVAINGDTAMVGAYHKDGTGMVYVYTRSGDTWNQQAKIIPDDNEPEDIFGYSIAFDDNIAVISAYGKSEFEGAVYIYKQEDNVWKEQYQFTASDVETGDFFGYAVGLSGNMVIVGAYQKNETGAVYIYTDPSLQTTTSTKTSSIITTSTPKTTTSKTPTSTTVSSSLSSTTQMSTTSSSTTTSSTTTMTTTTTTQSTTTVSTSTPSTSTTTTASGGSQSSAVIWIIIAIVLLGVGAAVWFIINKRRR